MKKIAPNPVKDAATQAIYGLAARGIPATQYTPLRTWVAVSLLTAHQLSHDS